MPIHRRLPKRGFNNAFRKDYAVLNIKDLERFPPNSSVDGGVLVEAGLLKKTKDGVKLLGEGDISHPLMVKLSKVSRSAKQKIETAGGRVELV